MVEAGKYALAEREALERDDTSSRYKVELTNEDGSINVQNPLPADGDSVYVKDLDLDRCDNGDFIPLAGREGDGTVADYFNSLTTVNTNTTSDNPKIITIHFNRSIQSSRIGFGCDDGTKGFGSIGDSITVKLLGSSGEVRQSETGTVTNVNSFVLAFEPETANGIIVEFNTTDPVSLSNIIIYKSVNTNATIQIQKPDGTIVEAQGTTQGNFKVSIEEFDDSATEYNTNDIEEASATVTYIGMENKGNLWYIKKIDTTTGCIFSHATINNNSGYATYDLAWTARASLLYENYGVAF